MASELVVHDFQLFCRTKSGLPLQLRPLVEADWLTLLRWNNDPDLLYYSEGDDVQSRSLEEVQDIYRTTSQTGLLFMVETTLRPIGECWIQHMNLPNYSSAYRRRDCRRIDIMIGEPAFWGGGVGTAVTAELTRFGFEDQKADVIYCCGIADYNARALAVVGRLGYRHIAEYPQPPGSKMRLSHDYEMTRDEFREHGTAAPWP